eukprot:gene248-4494_t
MNKLHLPSSKTSKDKVMIEFTIEYLTKLPKSGSILYVVWERGKKNSGETMRSLVKDKTVTWGADFSFKGTLFREKDGLSYKKKFMYFYVHEVKKENLGLNLGEYGPLNKDEQTTVKIFNLKCWDEDNTEMKITLKITRRDKNGDSITDSQATTDTDASFREEDDNSDGEDDFEGEDDVFDDSKVLTSQIKPLKVTEQKTRRNMSLQHDALSNFDPTLVDNEKLTKKIVKGRPKGHKRVNSTSTPGTDKPKGTHRRQASISGLDLSEKDKGNLISPKINILNGQNKQTEPIPKIELTAETPVVQPSPEPKKTKSPIPEEDDDQISFTELRSATTPLKKTPIRQRTNSFAKKKINIPTTTSNLLTTESNDAPVSTPLLQEALGELSKQEQELLALTKKLEAQKREGKERVLIDLLISTIEPVFNKGIPSSAPLLYKSLIEFNCFNVNEQSQFPKKIIKAIKQMVEKSSSTPKNYCFWLSNIACLINLIKLENPTLSGEQKKDVFLRMSYDGDFNELTLKITDKNKDDSFQSPIEEFKENLENLLSQTYSRILLSIYQELMPIVIPSLFDDKVELNGKLVKVNPSQIIKILKQYLYLLNSNGVFKDLIKEFYQQVFYFIENHLLNFMLKNDKYCTMGASIQLKMGATSLENWASDEKLTNLKLQKLKDISNILMMPKEILVEKEARDDICPTLKESQIAKMVLFYHKDDLDPMGSVEKGTAEKISTAQVEFEEEYNVHNPIFKLVEMPSWRIVDVPKGLQEKEEFEFLAKKN